MHFQFAGMSSNDFDAWIAKLKASDESLDAAAYEQLAKPSTREPVRHYAHVADGLYHDIVMQYMPSDVEHPPESGDDCSMAGAHHVGERELCREQKAAAPRPRAHHEKTRTQALHEPQRSAERRVGKEGVRTCKTRWGARHLK